MGYITLQSLDKVDKRWRRLSTTLSHPNYSACEGAPYRKPHRHM